jgi:hypothetical protein
LPFTSAASGRSSPEALGELGLLVDVDRVTRRRARSLRARCAIRLSIRRGRPEWAAPKKTRSGRVSLAIQTSFSLQTAVETQPEARVYTQPRNVGVVPDRPLARPRDRHRRLLAALIAPRRALVVVVAVWPRRSAPRRLRIGGWHEASPAGSAARSGAGVVASVVTGTLRRGGTRGGTAMLVGFGAWA